MAWLCVSRVRSQSNRRTILIRENATPNSSSKPCICLCSKRCLKAFGGVSWLRTRDLAIIIWMRVCWGGYITMWGQIWGDSKPWDLCGYQVSQRSTRGKCVNKLCFWKCKIIGNRKYSLYSIKPLCLWRVPKIANQTVCVCVCVCVSDPWRSLDL